MAQKRKEPMKIMDFLTAKVEVKKTFPKTFTVQPLNVVHLFTVYPFPPKRRSTVRPLAVHDRAPQPAMGA